jgi:hypothetical protein
MALSGLRIDLERLINHLSTVNFCFRQPKYVQGVKQPNDVSDDTSSLDDK